MDVETELEALLIVSAVSVAAPFVSAFLARLLVPQVVVLIAGAAEDLPAGFDGARDALAELLGSSVGSAPAPPWTSVPARRLSLPPSRTYHDA